MNLDTLRGRLCGSLATTLDQNFGAAADALIWNGRKPDRTASLIVGAASTEDVQEAVRFAAANGLKISPRFGRPTTRRGFSEWPSAPPAQLRPEPAGRLQAGGAAPCLYHETRLGGAGQPLPLRPSCRGIGPRAHT